MQPAYIMLDLNEMENKENGIEGWDFDVETYFLPPARSPGTLTLLHCYIARCMLALGKLAKQIFGKKGSNMP